MLEYTYQEAIAFLQSNLHRATNELHNVTTDLLFVRDQIVTSEVNISRIYNYDIRQKRILSENPNKSI
jgi:Prefoldin subunit